MKPTMRPGIYTDYTLTPVYRRGGGRTVGIAAHTTAEAGGVQVLHSLGDAVRVFGARGEDNPMAGLLAALFGVTAPRVYALGIHTGSADEYCRAARALHAAGAYLLLTDCREVSAAEALCREAEAQEMLAVFPVCPAEHPAETANRLNSRRALIACPPVYEADTGTDLSAALLTALVSADTDPGGNLVGAEVRGGYYLRDTMEEEEIERCLQNGVCIFEQQAGGIVLIRGVTTETRSAAGSADYTCRNLSVTLVMDTVIPALKQTLEQHRSALRRGAAGLSAVLSLVSCRLDDFVREELITSYATPLVSLDPDDRTLCLVEVGFTVAQGISTVYLTAHLSV